MESHSPFFSLNDFISISEPFLFQQNRIFETQKDEEIETLIHDYQHVDDNSERHEVDTLEPFVEKNKNMAYQGMNAFVITYWVCYWSSAEICRGI